MADTISESAPIMDQAKAINDLGDEALFNTLMEKYDDTLLKTLEELKLALDTFDYKEVRMKSHSLKGPSSYLQAERVRKAAEIVQFNVDKQDANKLFLNYPLLIEECIKLRRHIRSYIAKRQSK